MSIQRDRVFWTAALQAAILNYYLGGFGPAQPLLRTEQHTSLTVGGLHGTAMGIAAIISGLTLPKLVHKYGRAQTSWIGMAFFGVGVLGFIFAPSVELTLTATLVGGYGQSLIVNSLVTHLSAHFGSKGSQAVSQAVGIGSFGYIFGTLAVGSIAGTSFSWRLGLIIVPPLCLVLWLMNRGKMVTEHVPEESGPQGGKLSGQFWFAWIGFVACISTEFAITFWSAALLRNRVGASAAISTVCIVAFGIGMAAGRWFGPRVIGRIHIDSQLKLMTFVQCAGFMTLWFSHSLWISLVALLAAGLGQAMQFGTISVRLIGFSDDRPDLAIGISSLGAGLAIAGAPFLLGVFGDHLGISRAYLMVPVLIAVTVATIFLLPSKEVQPA